MINNNLLKVIIFVCICIFILLSNSFAKIDRNKPLHHIFPKQFELYFKKNGISNIHAYTILLNKEEHNLLHCKHKPQCIEYNEKWKKFIQSNPSANRSDLFGYAAYLLSKLKIKQFEFYDYNSRQKTGEIFDVSKTLNNFKNSANFHKLKKISTFGKNAFRKIARPVEVIYTLYEGGKIVKDYLKNDEINIKRTVQSVIRVASEVSGAEVGTTIGSIVCTPTFTIPPGYYVCVGSFTLAGGIAGNKFAYCTNKFFINNENEIYKRFSLISKAITNFNNNIIFNDIFQNNTFINKAIKYERKAINYYAQGNTTLAKEKIGDAYFFLAYAAYHKALRYESEFLGEIYDQFMKKSNIYFNLAIEYFHKSIDLSPQNSYTYYFLAEAYLTKEKADLARKYYKKSKYYFQKDHKKDILSHIDNRMSYINAHYN
jgi:hypothetical protein